MSQFLPYSYALYIVAALSSMAGMEIFGWLTALCALTLTFIDRGKTSLSIGPDWALIGFFIIGCIGVFTNGLFETQGEKMIGSLRWVLLLYLLYYAVQRVRVIDLSQKSKQRFLNFLLFWSVFAGIYGIIQCFTGIDLARGAVRAVEHATGDGQVRFWRTKGLFSMPLTYAYSYGMVTAMMLAFFLRDQFKGSKKWICLFGVAVLYGSIITTYARGGWLGIAGSSALILFLALPLKRFLMISTPAITVLVAIFASTRSLQQRVLSIFDMQAKGSTIRFDLWRANFEMFRDHPFFGVGYRQSGHMIKTYFEKLGIDNGFAGHAHSTYFEVLAGTGGLGFICYAGFSLTFLYFSVRLWRNFRSQKTLRSAIALGAIGAQVHFHIGGLTEACFFDAEVNHMLLVIWSLVGYLYLIEFRRNRLKTAAA